MKTGKVLLAISLAGGISILVAFFGQKWLGDPKATNRPLPGLPTNTHDPLRHLPAFSLPTLDGQVITSSDWTGEVVILNFWATWCLPCLSELAILQEVQAENEQVRVIGIAIDTQEEVARYLSKNPVNFQILMGDTEAVEMSRRLGNRLQGLPFTIIFDSKGRRIHAQLGEITQTFLKEKLEPLTAEATRSQPTAN